MTEESCKTACVRRRTHAPCSRRARGAGQPAGGARARRARAVHARLAVRDGTEADRVGKLARDGLPRTQAAAQGIGGALDSPAGAVERMAAGAAGDNEAKCRVAE